MSDRFAGYKRLVCDRPHPKVLRVTLTNGKMNAADALMQEELLNIWRDIDRDTSVHSVIVTGAGKVFSAGGDFDMVQDCIDNFDVKARGFKEARELVMSIIDCSKPIVSAMRGVAVGQGLVVGMMSDISLATKDCRLIDGHTRLGVAAGDHSVMLWPLLCGMAKAKYYLLTCDTILGAEAERIGLISFALEDSELDSRALEIATRLAEGAQSAIRWTKFALNSWLRQAGPAFDLSLALEMLGFGGPDVQEGLNSFREKRKPAFPKDSQL
ncbi:MAG TPA: enoyl-CoA hydratase/isomerase family protein [Dongiaceae bacterium]|jgi:enoyl-CoA hydratase